MLQANFPVVRNINSFSRAHVSNTWIYIISVRDKLKTLASSESVLLLRHESANKIQFNYSTTTSPEQVLQHSVSGNYKKKGYQ